MYAVIMPATWRFPWTPPAQHAAIQPMRLSLDGEIIPDLRTAIALQIDPTITGGHVDRRVALAIPAMLAARDYMCGVLGSLPIHCINAAGETIDHPLIDWPESLKGYMRAHTMSMTLEDLWLEGQCLWLVTSRDSTGFPTSVERQVYGSWNQDEDGTVWAGGRERMPEEVILFLTGSPGLLSRGANTIRMLRRLEIAAALHNETPEALEYFAAKEGQALPDDDKVNAWLADYQAKRAARAAAFIPDGMERHEIKGHTAEEMQHIAQREFAIAEVSRMTGIPPNWIALQITTRTYTNSVDERRDWVDLRGSILPTLVEQRLSKGDVCPRGQYVKWNYAGFLRSDIKTRYETYKIAQEIGLLTTDEMRAYEDLPPIGGTDA